MNRSRNIPSFVLIATGVVALTAATTGCITTKASQHHAQLPESTSPELTLGVFQQRLRTGMPAGDVAASVGSPNMVTSAGAGKQTWVYDKISSESSFSESTVGGGLGAGIATLFGSDTPAGIGGQIGASKSSGASRTSQKTLTVVVRFENDLLTDWTYHQSKF